jgi:hypothetical protein
LGLKGLVVVVVVVVDHNIVWLRKI